MKKTPYSLDTSSERSTALELMTHPAHDVNDQHKYIINKDESHNLLLNVKQRCAPVDQLKLFE